MTNDRSAHRVDPSRKIAAVVLREVAEQGAFANLVLPKALRAEQSHNRNFDFRDAAFTSELVYGTLRQQGYLDTVLAEFSTRPLDQLDPEVLQLLRLGAYQLLFMRVPDHAAVSETVAVAREILTDGPVKMVNAVLRSITRATPEELADIFDRIGDPTARLAAKYSHPEWIVDATRTALEARGISADELPAALEANNETPKVTLVARPGLITPSELADEAETVLQTGTSQGQLSEYAVVINSGSPAALSSVRAGTAAVQDEGSQLAALLLADAPIEGADQRWLDLCAGPGGKTALLAAIGRRRGARVTANEVVPHRAKLVKSSVQALDNVSVVTSDGRTFAVPEIGGYDRVLIDAPCTGLGSLRRRPESRWRHAPKDVEELVPLQRELLMQGLELTRVGGILGWVTCTPVVDETIAQVDYLLSSGRVELVDATELAQRRSVLELEWPTPPVDASERMRQILESTVQLWPHRHGTDAMFIAILRRTA